MQIQKIKKMCFALSKALEKSIARRPPFAIFFLFIKCTLSITLVNIRYILIFSVSELLSTNDLVKDRFSFRGQYPEVYFVENSKYADVSPVFKTCGITIFLEYV